MLIKHVGIITGGAEHQAPVNIDHAHDIGSALSDNYQIHFYDLFVPSDIDQMVADRRKGQLDIVFNNSAGKKGGDGTVEGLMEIYGIPFVGSDTLATAAAFDKKTTKTIVAEAGVPIIKGVTVTKEEFEHNPSSVIQNVTGSIGYPVVVKASQGSDSLGISLVKQPKRLIAAIEKALIYDETVIIEEFIVRSAEITCMVIGNGSETESLQPVERVYKTELLYDRDTSSRSYRIPVCSDEIQEDIMRYSVMAHQALGCSDYSRSDFLVNKRGVVFFLEINAHAGLGMGGPTQYAIQLSKGWDYAQLIEGVLTIAEKRYDV